MQNGLDRLLDGIAVALREDVLPEVDDSFARSQLLAAGELLANLSGRVEWRCDALAADVEGIHELLGRPSEPLPSGNAELLAARDAALADLAEVQRRGLDTPELRAFLAARLDRELSRVRTGMYR
ncbi:MAG TPA: hypothetical protein VFQ28_11105 [Gaiella sp.]|nr:hypothetical protein [Gaiella sp.]